MLKTPDKNEQNISDLRELGFRSISTILDSIDALVYVSDMDTYELIFANQYGRDIWGNMQGETCWKVLQEEQDGPCSFCTNSRLLDNKGKPTGVYIWEFQNTKNNRWYQCRDQAITWVDGRIVRMEIATDITERKQAEDELKKAKRIAEAMAYRDELTGLNNRRAFFDMGHRAFKQSVRFSHPISVVMMDLDHFKNINDTYGHAAGDEVLKVICNRIRQLMREIDIVARMGGEEFAFLLPETANNEAIKLTERIRLEIENTIVKYEENEIKITASFGVCSCKTGGETLDTMLTKADEVLYIAKRKGRNQTKSCL